MNLRHKILIGSLVLLVVVPQHIRALTPVPEGLPSVQKAEFAKRYLELTQQHDALSQRIDQFNAKYQSIPENSSLADEAVQQQAAIKTEKTRYKEAANAYEGGLASAIKTVLEALDTQIPKTREQLLKVTQRLEGFQASSDEWINLADDARDKARVSARDTVATLLLEKLSMHNESETALDEKSLKRINGLLRDRVFMNDLYAQVLTVQNLDALKTDADVIKILKTVKGTLNASNMELKDREGVLKAVLKGIETVNKDPAIALLIADGEITIDSAYGWLAAREARQRVDQLLNLSGDQLKAVTAMSNLYEKEIKNRKSLMAALQK